MNTSEIDIVRLRAIAAGLNDYAAELAGMAEGDGPGWASLDPVSADEYQAQVNDGQCIHCDRAATDRGCCRNDAKEIRDMIREGRTTDEEMVRLRWWKPKDTAGRKPRSGVAGRVTKKREAVKEAIGVDDQKRRARKTRKSTKK